jgi:hypothetical protein
MCAGRTTGLIATASCPRGGGPGHLGIPKQIRLTSQVGVGDKPTAGSDAWRRHYGAFVAIGAVRRWLESHPDSVDLVVLVAYSASDASVLGSALGHHIDG